MRHFGIEPILWGYLDAPSQNAINALHPKFGKLVEVGWVYTVVAGLLNILAIYDAYEGPAYGEEEAAIHGFGIGATERGGEGMTNINIYWYVLPLAAAISLVYAASRHESWPRIWGHAGRLFGMILGILVATTLVLLLINTQI